MIIYPKAKINLGLKVVERREDGFHNLESLFVDLLHMRDILEINESDTLSLNLYGVELVGNLEDNLVMRAYHLLAKEYNLPPVRIDLYKKIGAGSGLGGGSSDGASALILLNQLFELNIVERELMEYAAQLGSDCPYFIYAQGREKIGTIEERAHRAALIGGRGEVVTPYSLPILDQLEIKVVTPPLFISTAEAFSQIVPKKSEISIEEILEMEISQWPNHLINHFEEPLFKSYPELREIKEQLYQEGALYASMSGSGPSIYGLFKRE